jgi:hypothetical protein
MQQEGPGTQPAMQLRVARHTQRLQEVVRFYRDGIGLTEIGGFRGHDGYDGVFLAVPDTGAHLELTAGGGQGAPPWWATIRKQRPGSEEKASA